MKLHHLVLGLASVGLLLAARVAAQEPAKEDPVHDELRALKKGLEDAVNKSDIEAVLKFVHPKVILTAQNAEVSRGKEGIRAYFDKMMKGPNRRVESLTVAPVPDDLSIIYNNGNTAVTWGSSEDHYKLVDGMDFKLKSRWSATVVKEDGKWLVANFHASTNIFENPVLDIYVKKISLWVGLGAGFVGLVLGVVVARLFRKRTA